MQKFCHRANTFDDDRIFLWSSSATCLLAAAAACVFSRRMSNEPNTLFFLKNIVKCLKSQSEVISKVESSVDNGSSKEKQTHRWHRFKKKKLLLCGTGIPQKLLDETILFGNTAECVRSWFVFGSRPDPRRLSSDLLTII